MEKLKVDFEGIREEGCCLLSTEKDSVKLQKSEFKKVLQGIPIFYLPICIEFFESELNFDDWVETKLEMK